jgi:tetratricopeptide (TPR) repeat protein
VSGHFELGRELKSLQWRGFREVGDRHGEAITHCILGVSYVGRYEKKSRYFLEAVALFRAEGDRASEEQTLFTQGDLAENHHRYEEATLYFEQALAISRERGDRASEAVALSYLGSVAQSHGRRQEAARYYEQSMVIDRDIGNRRSEGSALFNLGSLAKTQGRLEEAARYYEQSLSISEELGETFSADITREMLEGLRTSPPPAEPSDPTPQPLESSLAPESLPPAAASPRRRRKWWPFGS